MKTILLSTLLLAGSVSFAALSTAKIDWSDCKAEIREYCTTSIDDLEKHACLSEAPKATFSKACSTQNEKAEKMLSANHDDHQETRSR